MSVIRHSLYGFEMREPDKRRNYKGDKKRWEIKQLWQRNHEMINLASLGYRNSDIARILNCDPQTVSDTLNSELGERKLSEIRFSRDEDIKARQEKIRILTDKALQVYHEIFEDESGECSYKDKKAVADTVVLELSGLRAPTKVQSHHIHTELSAEEIAAIRERGLEAVRESGIGIVVDAELSEGKEEGN